MADMVIKIPAELKPLVSAVQDLVEVLRSERREVGRSQAVDYGAVEASVAESVAGIERASHEVLLQSLDVDHPRVEVGGNTYTQVGRYEAPYYTMAGAVRVERSVYRQDGHRNAKVVDPVALRAGCVVDSWLPRTAAAMAHRLQQGTSREAEAMGRQEHRLAYSRSSFERVGHAVGELYVASSPEIEDRLIKEYTVSDQAKSVSVSIDRTTVPMEEPAKRPAGRQRKDAPKNPISVKYRQGYCGTLTLHDEEGDALHTIRYGRMPQGDAVGLAEGLADDVLGLLRKRPDLDVVKLLDGAPELWKLIDTELTDELVGKEIYRMIDKWHVLEKLDAAAAAVYDEEARKSARHRWRMWLRNSSHAAERILVELEESGKEWVRVGDDHPVHDAITYLQNNGDRMNYAAARRANLPVGSGNVEATCKTLFGQRMKRSGSRWKEETGEEIIQLRALALSDRWERAMELTLQPLARAVRRAA